MTSPITRGVAAMLSIALVGCATTAPERSDAPWRDAVENRLGIAPETTADWTLPPIPQGELDLTQTRRLAITHSPRAAQLLGQLGVASTQLVQARRLPNPVFAFSALDLRGTPGKDLTQGLSWDLTALLLAPARARMARLDFQRAQAQVSAAWVRLALLAEQDWYAAVGAAQVEQMRAWVYEAAAASAELTQRYVDAGNAPRIDLDRARAEADAAKIGALRARARAERARVALADRLGIAATEDWHVPSRLPAPPDAAPDLAALLTQARSQRLDLQAAERRVAARLAAATHVRRWSWLGESEVEYEREREPDGEKRGPGIRMPIPLFDNGGARRERANRRFAEARVALTALEGQIDNAVRLGVGKLNTMRSIAQMYRESLVPARERVVARAQEQQNYGFIGAFELLAEQRETYDAYQEYLEAVRDYWIARSALRATVGGRLPDDDALPQPSLGVEELMNGDQP